MSRFARFFYIVFSVMLLVGLSAENVRPVSAQGNGRPILVVYNDSAANRFGRYLGEILRAEGLNSFDMASLVSVSASQLGSYRAVILAETPLTSGQASLFTNYVNGGGYLIAMRPDAQIKNLFGLNTANGTQADGYLAMPGNGPSQGLSTATLQIHGTTDRYSLSSGAVTIAQLYSNATTSTAYPAVARSANGRGTAFLYDLARNVVYTRQGNPANANIDVDNDTVLRTIDLFQGSTPWVNLDKVAIPQADMQQRLFARLVRDAVANAHPLPQLWYFPGTAKSVLVITSDAHANPVAWYQTVVTSMNALNADVTFYLSIGGGLANSQVQTWRGQGHEFGIHPYAYRPDTYPPYNITSLSQGYTVYSNWFGMTFSTPKSRTVRNHQVAWRGWTDAADYAVANGMAMDTNFYSWGRWLRKSNGTWARGYVNGSGQPMKFMRADGTILPYYQQMTTLVDEQLISGAGDGGTLENLSVSGAATVSRQLIDASIAGDYAAIMTQFHVDYYAVTRSWAENVVSYAASKSMPLWNADRWLQFTESRYGANYNNLNWNGSTRTLSFNLSAPTMSGTTLSTMLPLNYLGGNLESVQVDGAGASYTTQTISGVNVAFVTVSAGNHSFVVDYAGSSGPSTPTNTPTNTPTATNVPPNTPTNTPTNTPIFSPTPTNTPTPTDTPTNTPTPTTNPGGSQTITLQINNSTNDVNEVNGTLAASQPAIWIGNGGSTTTSYTGLRFTDVSIPRGATITSAYLQFYSAQSQWILLNLQLSAEAADNSLPFASNSRPSQRPLTSILNHSSDVGWDANTWYNFNEMASVVQQVVNRSGWQSGNSLSIILKGIGTGTWGRKFVYGFEGSAGFAARLVITYSN
jgi:hypothetical protein